MNDQEIREARQEVQEALEAEGAVAVRVDAGVGVGSNVNIATLSIEYDGDSRPIEAVENKPEYPDVVIDHMETQAYMGGDMKTVGTLIVPKGASPGSNPGGNGPQTGSQNGVPGQGLPSHPFGGKSFVDPQAQSNPVGEQHAPPPHCAPGTRIDVADDQGFRATRQVEVWPVRTWAPARGHEQEVPAMTVLRYVPAPDDEYVEDTMAWWSGYVRACPNPADGHDCQHFVENMRAHIDTELARTGSQFKRTYGPDSSGWIGWDSLSAGRHSMDNREAADRTERLAEAVASYWRGL